MRQNMQSNLFGHGNQNNLRTLTFMQHFYKKIKIILLSPDFQFYSEKIHSIQLAQSFTYKINPKKTLHKIMLEKYLA